MPVGSGVLLVYTYVLEWDLTQRSLWLLREDTRGQGFTDTRTVVVCASCVVPHQSPETDSHRSP